VVGSGVRLVFTAPYGPVKSQVNRLIIFVGEVEQASDLAEGESNQPAPSRRRSQVGVLLFFIPA
jgi:hypothetical protein